MRTSVLAAGGVALALVLSACGGDGDSKDSALPGGDNGANSGAVFSDISQLVASAQEQTNKSQSSSFTMEMDMGGMRMQAQGEGVYAGANTQMFMTMQMDMPELQGMGMDNMNIEMILDGQTMYMKMPSDLNPDPSKPWVKMSMGEAMGSQNFDQMAQQSDPTKMLEQLQQAGGEITGTEQTTLDGQQVTQYTIEVDPLEMMDSMGGGIDVDGAELAGLVDSIGVIPMELYLNSEGLPVRIEMHVDFSEAVKEIGARMGEELPADFPTEAFKMSMGMTYEEWGTPVSIEAPPADQVSDAPAF